MTKDMRIGLQIIGKHFDEATCCESRTRTSRPRSGTIKAEIS